MTKPPTWLLDHKKDHHSLDGEDGVIEKALTLLPRRDRWCVEFGAWDGIYLSNTRHLIESQGYSAVLIEGDSKKAERLRRNYAGWNNVVPLNAFVGFTEADGLDTILAKLEVPTDFDFLSIDIDGNDIHTWRATKRYRPKLVCIEYNHSIPTEVRFAQPADPAVMLGSSLASLVDLGKEKGYELVAVTRCNGIFVDAQYYPAFEIEDNSPHRLRTDTSSVTYMFVGYDGTVHLQGYKALPWHRFPLDERKLQRLPRLLQKYPDDYSLFQKAVFASYALVSAPRVLVEGLRREIAMRRRG
jgi:hypothetical protein